MELKIPEEVAAVLGEDPDREALEALLLQLVRSDREVWRGPVACSASRTARIPSAGTPPTATTTRR